MSEEQPPVKVTERRNRTGPSVRPSEVVARNESADRIRNLQAKLFIWLMEQPEWMFVLTQGDRAERKRMAKAVARSLLFYPRQGE